MRAYLKNRPKIPVRAGPAARSYINGFISIYQKINITVNGVEHQKTINVTKLENEVIDFQQQSLSCIITTRRKSRVEDSQILETKLHRVDKTPRCAWEKCPHCACTSSEF